MNRRDEPIARLLTDPVTRKVTAHLADTGRAHSLHEIAEQVVCDGGIAVRSIAYEQALERTRIALHHDHLPRLEAAGLIEYDRVDAVACYSGAATAVAEWLSVEELDGLYPWSEDGVGGTTDAVGILEGSEAVYEYGRELADTADTELFLIYASKELLDEACLPHAEDAIDRGVSFYAGVKSEGARQFFQRSVPEARVWEPQLDWLNERGRDPQVSRLILADRERVVIGIWDEREDGTRREVAIVGEGATHPVVVIVRELLGTRLDHLDFQSDDFLETASLDR